MARIAASPMLRIYFLFTRRVRGREILRNSAAERGGRDWKSSLCNNVCPSLVRRAFNIPPQHHSISCAPGPNSPKECVEQEFSEVSKVKANLRRAWARSRETLVGAIGRAICAVTDRDAHAFCEHCGYRLQGQPL